MIIDLAELQRESDRIKKMGDAIETAFKNARAGSEKELAKISDAIEKVVKNTEKEMKKTEPAIQGVSKIVLGAAGATEAGLKTIAGAIPQIASAMENSSFNSVAETISQGLGGIASQLKEAAGKDENSILVGLSSIASMGGKVSSIAGIVVSVGETIYNAVEANKQAMIQAGLEEHFGNIKLSADDLRKSVEKLTENPWTIKLDAYISSKTKFEEFETAVNTAVSDLDQLDWKIGVGLDLTEEDKENYKSSINSFINNTLAQAEQYHYSVNLALDVSFDTTSGTYTRLSNFVDTYYLESYGILNDLGEKLAGITNKAFEENALSKYSMDIQKLRQQMTDLVEDLTGLEIEGLLGSLEFKFSGMDKETRLSVETFKELNSLLSEEQLKIQEQFNESSRTVYASIQAEYRANIEAGIAEEVARELADEAYYAMQNYLNEQTGTLAISGFTLGFDQVKDAYTDQTSELMDYYKGYFEDSCDELIEFMNGYNEDGLSTFGLNFTTGVEEVLSDDAKAAVNNILQEMQPQKEALEKMKNSYLEMGRQVPQWLTAGLSDIYLWEAMTGNTDNLFYLLGEEIVNSPGRLETVQKAVTSGQQIPEGLLSAIEMYSGEIYDPINNIWTEAISATDQSVDILIEGLNSGVIDGTDTAIQNMIGSYGLIRTAADGQWMQITEAALENTEVVKEALSTYGIEASDALANSIAGQSESVRAKAMILFQQLYLASEEDKPYILASLANMGIEMDNSLGNGIASNLAVIETSTAGMYAVIDTKTNEKLTEIDKKFVDGFKKMGAKGEDALQNEVDESIINGPSVDLSNWSTVASNYLDAIQRDAANRKISVGISMGGGGRVRMMAFATGGIVESPEIALIGEAGPESIIPLSSSKRTRALELYTQTSEALGVDEQITRAAVMSSVSGSRAAMAFLAAGPVPSENRVEINYKKLAQELYGALSASPIQVKPSFTVTGGDIYLDTTKAGKALAPHIDAELGRINHRRERGI